MFGDGAVQWPGSIGLGPVVPAAVMWYATGSGGLDDTHTTLYADGVLAASSADFTAGRSFPGVPFGNSVVSIPAPLVYARTWELRWTVATGSGLHYFAGVIFAEQYLFTAPITGWSSGLPVVNGHQATDADNQLAGLPGTGTASSLDGFGPFPANPIYMAGPGFHSFGVNPGVSSQVQTVTGNWAVFR